MIFFTFWGSLPLLFLCFGAFAIDFGIASNNAAALDGNPISSMILEGGEIIQVLDLQPDPTPLLIAGQSDDCSNPIKRRSRSKRDQTFCQFQQFRVSPPKTGNILSPSTEKQTSPVTPTTPGTRTEEPLLHMQTLMKLSDKDKCFQYEKMKTAVCTPGFPDHESPASVVSPAHESIAGDPCLPLEDLWCCEEAVPLGPEALRTWYSIVGDRYKDMGLICVLYDYLPASSEQQGSFGTNRHEF